MSSWLSHTVRTGLATAAALLLLAPRVAAAGKLGPATPETVSRWFDFLPTHGQLLGLLRSTPTVGAVFVVVAALVPLLVGGRLLRLACALALGCASFALLDPFAGQVLGTVAGAVAGCCGALAGGALGWYAYEHELKLLAGLLAGACGLALGTWLDVTWLTALLVLVPALAAYVLSRKVQAYLGPAETVTLGALLASFGVMSLASGASAATIGWVGLGTVLGSAALGLFVQLRLARSPGGK